MFLSCFHLLTLAANSGRGNRVYPALHLSHLGGAAERRRGTVGSAYILTAIDLSKTAGGRRSESLPGFSKHLALMKPRCNSRRLASFQQGG